MNLNKWISMKATIVYLIVLSALAALGTFISQGQSEAFYIENYGPILGRVIVISGLADLYHSPLFIALGIALCMVIFICTMRRLRGRKNRSSIGSVVLHFSFIVIVAGALVSAVTHADQDINMVQGDQVRLTKGALKGGVVDLRNFTIEWYDNGSASQYISDIGFRQGKKETSKAISVNHPLRQGFITIYQESYGWEIQGRVLFQGKKKNFRLREGGDLTLAPGISLATMFIPHFDPNDLELRSLTAEPQDPYMVAGIERDHQLASDLLYLKPGQSDSVEDIEVHFDRFVPHTGLRVKYDPGIPIVFIGFLCSLLGLALRFWPNARKEKA